MTGIRWLMVMEAFVAMLVLGCTAGLAPTPMPTTVPTSTPTELEATSAPPSPMRSATPSPSPTVAPLPSGLDPEVVAAIEWRRSMGLTTDPAFVIAAMADPDAVDDWAYPILQAEDDFIWRRQQDLLQFVQVVRNYGAGHTGFGGLYLDNEHSLVMSLWTSDPEGHLAEMLAIAGDDAPIGARLVSWTERSLQDVQDRIDFRWPGFAAADARLMGVGASTRDNVLELEISSANPDAPRLIADGLAAELGVPVEMLQVVSDGTGVELLPSGTVKGVVTLWDGSRPGWNDLSIDGDPRGIGYCGGGDIGYGVWKDGHFEIPCKIGDYVIQVWDPGAGPRAVIGEARVTVREGETTRVRIRLDR